MTLSTSAGTFALTFLLVFAGQADAAPPMRKFIGCPGRSITVYDNATLNEERVCMKIVKDLTNEPTSAEVWIHTLLGKKDLGRKGEFVCTRLGAGRNEVRVGGFESTTALYVLVDDPKLNAQIFDEDVASRIPVPPIPRNTKRLDECKAKCEQTPPPKLSARNEQRGCFWSCGNSGDWAQICPKLNSIDPATGKKITIEP